MSRQNDLLQAHLETYYTLDANGDMRATNWPNPSRRGLAPAFHIGWTDQRSLSCFRYDVSTEKRQQVGDLVASQWPFKKGPREGPRYTEILSEYCEGSRDLERVFILPEDELPTGDATLVTQNNAYVLHPGFNLKGANWMEDLDANQPCYAVIEEDQAVSVCQTVRCSTSGIEPGVKTLEDYRRRGYAKRAVAAWCQIARQEEVAVFYATGWSNEASFSLANSLGFKQFAMEFVVG